MILHLVTDRRRLAPGLTGVDATACVVEQARAAAAAGLDHIQVRERDLDGRALAELVRAVLGAVRGSRTQVIVNDRLDVALATGANGVHLRGDSMAATDVRRCAPPAFLIGRSVHSADDARSAGPVDYLIAGTVWATSSKPAGHPLLGVDGLARIASATALPVLAIGGVDVQSAAKVRAAGAAGLAAIGLWMGVADGCRAIPLENLVRAIHGASDAANMKTPFSTG